MSNSYSAIVNQAIELLDGMSIDEYQKNLPPHFPSSIGVHIRHIVDHFSALQEGYKNGHVNYNVRSRESQVEKMPKAATEMLNNIVNWLDNIGDDLLDKPLSIRSEIDLSRNHSTTCHSTLERELVFASSHAIHHYALVKIICAMQHLTIPELFGYAPATISHINKTA